MSYRTIKGAKQHQPQDQVEVDRAAEVLFATFGSKTADPELTREHLSEPQNILVTSEPALAIILRAGSEGQVLWLMWAEPSVRGKGIGSKLLKYILAEYASKHLMELHCATERVKFYERHGFHVLYTADERYYYMAGPAEDPADVEHLLPPVLRRAP